MQLSAEMLVTLGILVVAILLFVTERLRVDVVALGVIVALMVTDILTVGEALAGFSSSAVLLIAALFIVGGAVFQTGLASMLADQITKIAGTSETRLLVVVMVSVAIMSGFVSDTGTVAVLMPVVISVAVSLKLNPSRLLLPLAFASLLGGASTLIGTPPNIIVNEILVEGGFEPFQFFSYTPMGILLIAAGVIYMLMVRRYLPDRQPQTTGEQAAESALEIVEAYQLPDNIYKVRVRSASPFVGKTVAQTGIGHDYNLNLLEILRPPEPRKLAAIGAQEIVVQAARNVPIHPTPETELQHNDILILQGLSHNLSRLALDKGLAIQPRSAQDREALISREVGIAEIVLPPRSTLIGKTLAGVRFGNRYNLNVLSIRRSNTEPYHDVKDLPLEFGDLLLVQGAWEDIFQLSKRPRDFVIIGGTSEAQTHLYNRAKAPLTLLILFGMLIVLIAGWLPTTTAAMLASLLIVLTGCLSMDDAYNAIDWKSIVLIAGMIPMSTALEKVGLLTILADGFATTLGAYGPVVVMGGLFIITSAFTQLLSNTTTSVIIAPLALSIAAQLGVQPQAFLMAVAIAASMAFASPVASPVNTLVLGAGNYRFVDYLKFGGPLIAVMFILTVIALPILFPF